MLRLLFYSVFSYGSGKTPPQNKKQTLSFKILNYCFSEKLWGFFLFSLSLRKAEQILFHFSVYKTDILTLTYIKDMSQTPPAPYLEALAVSTKLQNKSLKYMFFIHWFCTYFAFHILPTLGQKLHNYFS